MESLRAFSARLGRSLGLVLCAALALALLCMAFAVLVQALAVLALGVLCAVFLLPKPLKWYAVQAAEALRAFVDTLLAPPSGGRKVNEGNSPSSGEDKA